MIKRITALICAFAIASLPFSGAALASETDIESKKTELTALGIEFPELLPKITKEMYIYALGSLLYDEPEKMYTAEELAWQTGMLEPGMEYNDGAAVTADEAVKYAVDVLGYGPVAELDGGYPDGYKRVAADIKLTKYFTASGNEAINAHQAVELIYEMLEIEPMTAYTDNVGNEKFEKRKDETLLSINRSIYKREGLLTAGNYTSIYSEAGAGEGYAIIDGESYIADGVDVDSLLGKNVVAYIYDGGSYYPELLYAGEDADENKEITIYAEDIYQVSNDFSVIRYIEESNRIKSAKLAAALKVIYNGEYCSAYNVQDLSPDVGLLRLVDNDSDGKYDVVFAESYKTMLVSAVVGTEIYTGYEFAGCLPMIDTYNKGDVDKCSIYKNGSEVVIDDIKADDIISVAASKNTVGQIIKIHISDSTLTGTISSLDRDNNEIVINEELYIMSQDFLDFAAHASFDLAVGNEIKIYTDAFGNIAYAKAIKAADYCLIYKVFTDEESYFVTYMDMNNEWHTSKISDGMKLDSVRYTTAERAYQPVKDLGVQLVKLKENADGEIKKIETPTENSQPMENTFTQTPQSSLIYRSGPQTFANTIYLNSGARIIIIPSDISNKENIEITTATTYLIGDRSYLVSAYDIDEFGFTDMILVTENDAAITARRKNSLLVVTDVMSMLTSDDEVMPAIAGSMGNLKVKLLGAKADIFDEVRRGDIINVAVNNTGKVDHVTQVFRTTEAFVSAGATDYYKTSVSASGYVEKVDETGRKIRLNCGGRDVSFRVTGSTVVNVYDEAANECRTINVRQLKNGDKAVCRISWGQLSEMVVLRSE